MVPEKESKIGTYGWARFRKAKNMMVSMTTWRRERSGQHAIMMMNRNVIPS